MIIQEIIRLIITKNLIKQDTLLMEDGAFRVLMRYTTPAVVEATMTAQLTAQVVSKDQLKCILIPFHYGSHFSLLKVNVEINQCSWTNLNSMASLVLSGPDLTKAKTALQMIADFLGLFSFEIESKLVSWGSRMRHRLLILGRTDFARCRFPAN